MDPNKGKLQPSAGNTSHPAPQPKKQYPWYATLDYGATVKENVASVSPTVSYQPATPPASQPTNPQESSDLSSRRQNSGESSGQQFKIKQIISPPQPERNPLPSVYSMPSGDLSKIKDWDQMPPRANRTFRSSLATPRQSEIRDSALKRYQQVPTGDLADFTKV